MNFIETRRVGVELFRADRQTGEHDKPNRRFRSFAKAPKKCFNTLSR